MNAELDFLAYSIVIEAVAKQEIPFVKTADGIMSSIVSGVKSYVLSLWDKDHPVSSIMSFMGNGLLWSMGFKWMSVLYSVAEALGFDWRPFWTAVGNNITSFVSSSKQISSSDASNKINDIVSKSFIENFKDSKIDKDKLLEIAKKKTSIATEIQDTLELKAIAIKIKESKNITKEAGVLSIFKGKLIRFFIKTISFLIKTALISLGFVSIVGATKSFTKSDDKSNPVENTSNQAVYHIKVSPNVSNELFIIHRNDLSNVWIEKGSIDNIDNLLLSWILNAYPQLSRFQQKLTTSEGFEQVVNKFRLRNRLAEGLNILSIPRPYQRKIDIVAEIVNKFLATYLEKFKAQSEEPTISYK